MISGIGCDVVELRRVADVYEKHGERFVHRILTTEELPLFNKRKALGEERLYAFLASRWAVKEAISKALGTGITAEVSFHAMEILHNASGAPMVLFKGELKDRLQEEGIFVHISITDERNVVAAFAVAEKRF